MRVSTLLDYLVSSELASLAGNDITKEVNLNKMLNYVNRALAEVNTELLLNQVTYPIALVPEQTRYTINDEKLIKIITGYNSLGLELHLNNSEDRDTTLFIPEYNTVEYYGLNKASATVQDFLSVVYLKGFSTIASDMDTININEGMTECIASYVGYLAHSALPKNSGNVANAYFQKYLAIIAKTKELNIVPERLYGSNKLDTRGFV